MSLLLLLRPSTSSSTPAVEVLVLAVGTPRVLWSTLEPSTPWATKPPRATTATLEPETTP